MVMSYNMVDYKYINFILIKFKIKCKIYTYRSVFLSYINLTLGPVCELFKKLFWFMLFNDHKITVIQDE